ncbi:MAG: thermonuclease family protein [Candidatus Thiodiazotropha sp. L084R]
MLALYPLWRKARRVYSLTSRLPGTNRLGFQPSLALSAGRAISVEYRVVMANGVILGTVKHGGADISLRMLKAGMARIADEAHLDPKTRRDYLAAETLAKSRRMGLWRLF